MGLQARSSSAARRAGPWRPPLPEPVARYSLVGVVLVVVALVRVVRVGVVLMLIALVRVVRVPRLAVVLVLVALMLIVHMRVVLVLVALVLVVPVAVRLAVVLVLVRVVLVLVTLVLVVHVTRLAVMLVLVALMRDVGCLYHDYLLTIYRPLLQSLASHLSPRLSPELALGNEYKTASQVWARVLSKLRLYVRSGSKTVSQFEALPPV